MAAHEKLMKTMMLGSGARAGAPTPQPMQPPGAAMPTLGAAMPILLNTYAGVLANNDELVEMAKSVGASRWRIFTRITIPSAVPFIVVGLRVGATIGLINTVVAELYTAVRGLGGLLAIYGNTFRMAEYFVIVLILAVIGVIVTEILRQVQLRLERWRGEAEA